MRKVIYLMNLSLDGGKPYFPALRQALPLRLLETRTFRNGSVYLRYQRAGSQRSPEVPS